MSDPTADSQIPSTSEPSTAAPQELSLHNKPVLDTGIVTSVHDASLQPIAPIAANPSPSAVPVNAPVPDAAAHGQTVAFEPLEDLELANTVPGVMFRRYDPAKQEEDIAQIRALISQDLSEPYGIYVYRYFLFTWPELCWMVCSLRNARTC
jgi:hypothetical protein